MPWVAPRDGGRPGCWLLPWRGDPDRYPDAQPHRLGDGRGARGGVRRPAGGRRSRGADRANHARGHAARPRDRARTGPPRGSGGDDRGDRRRFGRVADLEPVEPRGTHRTVPAGHGPARAQPVARTARRRDDARAVEDAHPGRGRRGRRDGRHGAGRRRELPRRRQRAADVADRCRQRAGLPPAGGVRPRRVAFQLRLDEPPRPRPRAARQRRGLEARARPPRWCRT